MYQPDNIAKNLTTVRHAIEQCNASKKPQLIAVSKRQPIEKIEVAISAGQSVFGENTVQEAKEKWIPLKQRFPQCVLHLIGPLQTNKVPQALALFDVIQTVDRIKLANILAKEMKKQHVFPECFIQINIGNELQKSGVSLEEADDFIQYCRHELALPVTGLMCIPPKGEEPIPYFTKLRNIAHKHQLPQLSMGMSSDFTDAIACGATYIRVGEAIFGKRQDN